MDESFDPIGKVNDMAEHIEHLAVSDPLDKRFPQELIEFVKATAEAIKSLQLEIRALSQKIDEKCK